MAILNYGGKIDKDSALTSLPSLKQDTSSGPRMLTPSEIDWMRQNKKASAIKLAEIFAEMKKQQAA